MVKPSRLKSPVECVWERGLYSYPEGGYYSRGCVNEYEEGYYCGKTYYHKEPPKICPSCWKNVVVDVKNRSYGGEMSRSNWMPSFDSDEHGFYHMREEEIIKVHNSGISEGLRMAAEIVRTKCTRRANFISEILLAKAQEVEREGERK